MMGLSVVTGHAGEAVAVRGRPACGEEISWRGAHDGAHAELVVGRLDMSCIVTGTVDSADAVEQLADLGDREAVKVIVLP